MSRRADGAGQMGRSQRGHRAALHAAVVLGLLILAGCGVGGPKTAHLSGTVSLGGQAVPADAQASISFKATTIDQGRSANAQIINGKYDLPNTPIGKVKVFFSIQQPTGKMAREGVGAPYAEYRSLTPAKYETGMDLEITGDNDKQDFNL